MFIDLVVLDQKCLGILLQSKKIKTLNINIRLEVNITNGILQKITWFH